MVVTEALSEESTGKDAGCGTSAASWDGALVAMCRLL